MKEMSKILKIVGIVTSAINLGFVLMAVVMTSLLFSIGSLVNILIMLSMVGNLGCAGIVAYEYFIKKSHQSKKGIVYIGLNLVSLLIAIIKIKPITAILSLSSGLLSYVSVPSFSLVDLFDKADSLGGLPYDVSSSIVWAIIVFVLFIAINIAILVMSLGVSKWFEAEQGVSVSENMESKVKKLKLTDKNGFVKIVTTDEVADLDLSEYEVEVVEDKWNESIAQAKESVEKIASKTGESLKEVNQKTVSFFKTPKGKKTLIGAVVGVVLVVAGVIVVPMLFTKSVNLTDNIVVKYEGFDGTGRVDKISYDTKDISEAEKRQFLNNVYYKSNITNNILKNGDEIEITAVYSELEAKRLKLDVKGKTKKVKVEGLPVLITSKGDYGEDLKSAIDEKTKEVVDEKVKARKLKNPKTTYIKTVLLKKKDGNAIYQFYHLQDEEKEGLFSYPANEIMIVKFDNVGKDTKKEALDEFSTTRNLFDKGVQERINEYMELEKLSDDEVIVLDGE